MLHYSGRTFPLKFFFTGERAMAEPPGPDSKGGPLGQSFNSTEPITVFRSAGYPTLAGTNLAVKFSSIFMW